MQDNYNEEQLDLIERAAGMGCTIDQIAYLLNIHPRTFDKYLHHNEQIKERVERGRAKAAFKVMGTAYTMAVSGHEPAMTMFWLKTRCRWREQKEPLVDNQATTDKIKSMPTSELIKLVKEKVG